MQTTPGPRADAPRATTCAGMAEANLGIARAYSGHTHSVNPTRAPLPHVPQQRTRYTHNSHALKRRLLETHKRHTPYPANAGTTRALCAVRANAGTAQTVGAHGGPVAI